MRLHVCIPVQYSIVIPRCISLNFYHGRHPYFIRDFSHTCPYAFLYSYFRYFTCILYLVAEALDFSVTSHFILRLSEEREDGATTRVCHYNDTEGYCTHVVAIRTLQQPCFHAYYILDNSDAICFNWRRKYSFLL